MPSFTDIASSLALPACCMRKNPTLKDQLREDLRMLGISFGLYLLSYWFGFHSLCLMSMISMNLLTFQAGITFHEVYSKNIHLNQFEELDSSMEADEDNTDYLSLKQREHGATVPHPMTMEQEEKLNEQLRQVVEETNIRNRMRSIARTPSSTTLVNDTAYPPIPSSDAEDEPKIQKPVEKTLVWSEVPNFSQTHYLHNYMDELD